MMRPQGPKGPKKGEFVFADDDFRAVWPLLAAGFGDPWWDDGKPREPWTAKLAWQADCVSLCVTDRENKLVSFTTAPSMKECFDAAEAALAAGGLSWRKSKY